VSREDEKPSVRSMSLQFLPLLFLCFIMVSVALQVAFIAAHWSNLSQEDARELVWALIVGLRFNIAVVAYLFIPTTLLYCATLFVPRIRTVRYLFAAWVVASAGFISVLWLADIQYFQDAGKHFTYEAVQFLNLDLLPIVSAAFRLHPWFSSFSLLTCLAISLLTAGAVRWELRRLATPIPRGRLVMFWAIFAVLLLIGTRGGLQGQPLSVGDSFISGSPYLNAVALNPIYSAFGTVLARSERSATFEEAASIDTVRTILEFGAVSASSTRYPLLRESPGTSHGNGKNVVLFLLESWTGKDVGALGATFGVTPAFDRLARDAVLFSSFFATGIRSPEGIFSVLCSFPNQPFKPIMARPESKKTNWRCLSHILEEAGYHNLFVHGSDLRFDGLEAYLKTIHFRTLIDKRSFSQELDRDVWGVNDEAVMHRADEEFAKQRTKPFFGVIYTGNTHPPFTIPKTFPAVAPSTSDSNRYLNSLRYSDYSLETFFRLARSRPYFKNTVFVLVADHTRTRDSFTFENQHRIPLLIYEPDGHFVGVNPVVGSQLDILPTVLAFLDLKAKHSSWGRNLLRIPPDKGFAVSVVGTDLKWRDNNYLLVDNGTDSGALFLCDVHQDPECRRNVWERHEHEGKRLKAKLRSYISLSQALLSDNRVFPPAAE
jgi:phosphoglycerol transferase MdoB-like AlkP superfamily enzyme